MNSIKNFGLKFALILAVLFCAGLAKAQDSNSASISIENVVIKDYKTVLIPVNLDNNTPVASLQFKMTLPEELEFDGVPVPNPDRLDGHNVSVSKGGAVMVQPNYAITPFEGSTGEIFSIPVKVKDGILESGKTVQVSVSDITMSTPAAVSIFQNSFDFSVSLNPFTFKATLDPTPLAILPGNEATISFCLENIYSETGEAAPVAALTADMVLPDGIELVPKSITPTDRMLENADPVFYVNNKLMLTSMSDNILENGIAEGPIFTFTVKADKNFKEGEITLDNLLVSAVVGAFPVEGETVSCPVKAIAADAQAAYEKVIESIDALQTKYEEALAAAKKDYPNYDFSEWEEIITNAINEAKEGAAQALATATEEGEDFSFPFDGSDIEAMIQEMTNSAARETANKAAYDKVIASLDAVEAEYEEALAAAKKENPEFDFSEFEEIITKAIEEAKEGAAQALAAANEEGEEYNFPFNTEEIENMIKDMQNAPAKAAFEAANKAAYDEVIASIDAVEAEYEEALAAAKKENPDFDFSEYEEIITNAINQAKEGAAQALESANEEGEEYNFPFNTEEIENMIKDMQNAPAKAALEAANKAAYDKVIASIDAVEAKYEEALAAAKKENPDFDFSEWEEIITNAINQAKEGAAQALDTANEEGEEYNFPFNAEEIENMIKEMQNAPAKAALEAANKAAYDKVVEAIDAVEAKYEEALAAAKKENPEFDFSEFEEIITKAIEDAKEGAAQALESANEEGEEYNFPFDTEEIENMIKDMQNAPAKTALEAANQAAYDKVIVSIDAVEAKYEEALAAAKKENPEFDFSEFEEIITKAIEDAKEGAAQALESANEEGEEYNFPFDTEEIENMIKDMQNAPAKAALEAANKAAYDKVIASIEAVEAEYNVTLAAVKEAYPDYDFSEMVEIITKAIEEAKEGAAQALAAANDEGVEFEYLFNAEDIENMIKDMQTVPAREAANKAAYDKVIAEIEAVEAEYEEALAAAKVAYPDYDFSEWENDITKAIEEAKEGAAQALAAANYDGADFDYLFNAEDIQNMIEDMKNSVKGSAVNAIEAEVAAGKAYIFTLDGKMHQNVVHGEVNVIVRENSTSKVFIK